MSLRDLACFTLEIKPSTKGPSLIELVQRVSDGREEARYARVREKVEGEAYSAAMYGTSLLSLLNTKNVDASM